MEENDMEAGGKSGRGQMECTVKIEDERMEES